jgi:ArsR family transcriptional regulator
METKSALTALTGLAQETRLEIFRELVEQGPEGLAAGALAERLGLANATLSFHLKELTHAQLVNARQAGRFIYYSANFTTMTDLVAYLTENCCRSQPRAACCGPLTPKPRIVARTKLENLA